MTGIGGKTYKREDKRNSFFREFAFDSMVNEHLSLMVDMPPMASGITTLPLSKTKYGN